MEEMVAVMAAAVAEAAAATELFSQPRHVLMTLFATPGLAPEAVVQTQLEAYNARDLDAWLATYASDARQFDAAGTVLAAGHEAIRARAAARFAEPNLHAELIRRTVIGNVVIDHESVTRNFPDGPGRIEMMCTYTVFDGLIRSASFVFGPPRLDAAAPLAAKPATAEVIGFDHVYLTVSDLARAERYYDAVMIEALGFRKNGFTLAGDPHLQYYNRHFGLVLRPARVERPHEPYSPGLHHACLRVDSIDEVQAVALRLQALGIAATTAAPYPEYSPDYWATFFNDPDGIRLEVTNFRAERRARMNDWDSLGAAAP
jgi:catechol 2,3-dioxygenase-like lactoylglutathione lyase family enzyme